jgi:AcrR family transcriptional regulator
VNKNIRQQQKDETRAGILAAARTLFLELGYEGTTTRQIADAAGVGTGTVFAHFPGKQQLLRELLFRDIENVLAAAVAELPDQAGAVDALLHYARHLYTYYRSQWALSQVLLKDIMFDTSGFQSQLDAFTGELTKRLLRDAPGLDEGDRAVLAQCMMASYFMVLIGGLGVPGSPLEVWMSQLERGCRLMLRPYRGPA